MTHPSPNLVSFMVLALLTRGAMSVAAGKQAPDLSGAVTVTATSVAAGGGW
jgi:hypothetical protein